MDAQRLGKPEIARVRQERDPGDGSLHQAANITVLHYAQDGRITYEEDAYNPMNFAPMVKAWIEADPGRLHHPDNPGDHPFIRRIAPDQPDRFGIDGRARPQRVDRDAVAPELLGASTPAQLEQAKNFSCDIYSFAVLFYEIGIHPSNRLVCRKDGRGSAGLLVGDVSTRF